MASEFKGRLKVDWERIFRDWSKPSSDTEDQKAQNVERMIRAAISENAVLSKLNISVFAQGSYKNNTNVRKDSDVDICVCLNEIVCSDYSLVPLMNGRSANLPPITYPYTHFTTDLERALKNKFGSLNVTRGNKAFDVHANSYRVDADIVPAMEGRRYYGYLPNQFSKGTCIIPNSGTAIYNWPQQNYDNGVRKNHQTNNRFKYITRAIKRLKGELYQQGYSFVDSIPSYLIECLVYLVPNQYFSGNSYRKNVEDCLLFIWKGTGNTGQYAAWKEINGIKFLFHSQKWNVTQVNHFALLALRYIQSRG